MLGTKAERDPAAADLDVAFSKSRDSEGLVRLRVAVITDPKPAEIDQPHGDRARPFRRHRLDLHVLRHRLAKCGERVGEAHELGELRRLLGCAVIVVVQVLPAAGGVDAGGLQLRARPGRDPDVFPGGRDRQRLDTLELRGVGDSPAAPVEIPEMASRADPCPPSFPRHGGRDALGNAP